MTSPPPVARLPNNPLRKADLDERDRYAKLTAESASTIRASAQTWRNGLTAFITLVTTGVVIKGRDSTSNLAVNWRILVIVLIAGGLLLAILGLWQALAAEAGTRPKKQTLQDIRAAYGTLDAYQVRLADVAARQLGRGIRAAAAAITLLLAGVVVTWVAPAATTPPVYTIVIHGDVLTCGSLRSAAGGQLRLTVASDETVIIPFYRVTGMTLSSACP